MISCGSKRDFGGGGFLGQVINSLFQCKFKLWSATFGIDE